MLFSRALIPTVKEAPADATNASHVFLSRAGYIRKVGAGIYDYLPLGYRVLRKVEAIVRQEMDRTGALEILMPALLPGELFKETGRWDLYGPTLFRIKDRKGGDYNLGPNVVRRLYHFGRSVSELARACRLMGEGAYDRLHAYGCGDWQWASRVDWGDAEYLGVDIVPTLVASLQREHGRPRVRFEAVDPDTWTMPAVDLVICKDVLQHLSNQEALSLVRRFEACARWVLYCNDLPLPSRPINDDTVRGGFRRIDLSKPPFSVQGRYVFHFSTEPDGKAVFLWSRDPARRRVTPE